MEDFPLLILFFIIYLIAGSSGRKRRKEKTARSGPMRTRAQGERRDKHAQQRDGHTEAGFQTVFSQDPVQTELHCEQRRVHLHDVSNEEMLMAGEGEDPCHAGGIRDMSMHDSDDPTEQETIQAQDVLRGVIMSEILMRPHERIALQRSRQKTNGY